MEQKRSLLSITLPEAVELLKICDMYDPTIEYLLRMKHNGNFNFIQIYSVRTPPEEIIHVNFDDGEDAVHLCGLHSHAHRTFKNHYLAAKFLEGKNFNIEKVSSTQN